MVPIVVSLNLALFFAQLAVAAPISPEFQCTSDGIHGNPENCLKFIICAHGQRQDFDCPQGTSWHADRGICDTTDLSKCTADPTATSSGNSEDVFKQHLLSLLADFKPCHAGETTPNPGQGGNGTTPGNGGPGETTPGNSGGNPTTPGNNGGSSTGNPGGNSSPNPDGGNTGTTPENGGESSPGNPGGSGTTPGGPTTAGPGQTTPGNSGGNPTTPGNPSGSTTTERFYHPPSNSTDGGSSPNPDGGNTGTTPGTGGGSSPNPEQGGNGSTPQPTSLPPPTCPACPIPTEKPCPAAPQCAACPDPVPQSCPAAPTCPPPAPAPKCPACPTSAACPAAPTCPAPPPCPTCPKPTEKVCPTAAPCPTTTPAPAKPTCPSGWTYYSVTSACYKFFAQPATNMAAHSACMKEGATLPSIHSDAENTFIFNMAVKGAGSADHFNVWVGLYRTGNAAANFASYDGTPYDYKKWLEGDPNFLGQSEFCVEMFTKHDAAHDGTWNDVGCGKTEPAYICKKAACADLINPKTGISDCSSRANLCNEPSYYDMMTVQCPRTCGRCA